MRDFGEGFKKMLEYAREQSFSFVLDYDEGEDNCSIQIRSIAKSEEYYEKRVYNINDFIENHKNYMKKTPDYIP